MQLKNQVFFYIYNALLKSGHPHQKKDSRSIVKVSSYEPLYHIYLCQSVEVVITIYMAAKEGSQMK